MFQPNFQITNNLLTYVSSIESAKAVIENSPLVPAWDAKFRSEALARTVHYGTKIEGNDLTREQAEKVVKINDLNNSKVVAERAGIVARDRDVQEVINYRNVGVWIDQQELTENKKIFSIETLKKLHQLTMENLLEPNEVGEFRNKQVIVRGASDGGVVFRPPVSIEVPYLLEDFFVWLNSPALQSLHPIFQAAITHYQLVFIHPFIEGNGRTARALATLTLYQKGYDLKKFFSLEQYFDNNVDKYYQALLSVQQSQNQNMTYWLEYFCYGLAMEIDKVKQQVMRLSKDLKLKKELGHQVALSERQIMILEMIQDQGELTSDQAQKALPNISIDTILRDIKDLIVKGVVEKQGVTKGVRYRSTG
jgi:Fic family protein